MIEPRRLIGASDIVFGGFRFACALVVGFLLGLRFRKLLAAFLHAGLADSVGDAIEGATHNEHGTAGTAGGFEVCLDR